MQKQENSGISVRLQKQKIKGHCDHYRLTVTQAKKKKKKDSEPSQFPGIYILLFIWTTVRHQNLMEENYPNYTLRDIIKTNEFQISTLP